MAQQRIKEKGKVFRDPVHRLIRIEPEDQFVLDLINSQPFQRLRRIRQLGVSSLTYHGAEHSRFVHSMGVFNFAQRIAATLIRRYGTDSDVARVLIQYRKPLLAAALLHDIGHGPFSHMIERAHNSSFDHEKMTSKLIREEKGEIHSVLTSHSIDPDIVASIIEKTGPHRLVIDIVSSQLDADRMDYLLRDSHMTGVEYGIYDAEWLLNAMCVGIDPSDEPGNESPQWRLCLDINRGLFAAEQLILARHHMMLQVYMHRVTRGYEVMLLNLFKHAASLLAKADKLPEGTHRSVLSYFKTGIDMPFADWLNFDETSMVATLQNWGFDSPDPILKRFSTAFLERDRLYIPIDLMKVPPQALMELNDKLNQAGLAKGVDWGTDDGVHLPYKGLFHKASKGDTEEQSALSILLSDGSITSRGSAIENHSKVLKGLDNEGQSVTRLYISRDKFDKAIPVLDSLRIAHGGAA